jgi:hypothetical protein
MNKEKLGRYTLKLVTDTIKSSGGAVMKVIVHYFGGRDNFETVHDASLTPKHGGYRVIGRLVHEDLYCRYMMTGGGGLPKDWPMKLVPRKWPWSLLFGKYREEPELSRETWEVFDEWVMADRITIVGGEPPGPTLDKIEREEP